MALQRQLIPIRFNQGIDVGGEDPRVKVGGLLKAENLLVDRGGVLVARDGLTTIGKGARAVTATNSVIVFTDPRSGVRAITNGTFSNSRITNELAYSSTVWDKVVVGPEINANVNSWCQMTPLVFSQYKGGTNVYAYLEVANGSTRTARVDVIDQDRGGVIATKTLLANTNAIGMTYDSEDGKVYFIHGNTGATQIRYSICNLYASSPSFTSNANTTGLSVNIADSYSTGIGIIRYEKDATNNAGSFIKRLVFSYFHTNATATNFAVAAAINTSTMALGAETNETSQWSSAIDGTLLYTDVKDLGMRSADTNWRLQANTAANCRVVQWVTSTNTAYPLVMTSSGLGFGTNSGDTDFATTSTRLGDSVRLVAASGTGSNQSVMTTDYGSNGAIFISQTTREFDDRILENLQSSCRPFTMSAGNSYVDIYPTVYYPGLFTGSPTALLKASTQYQHILFADGVPTSDSTNTAAYMSARLSVGNAYTGATRNNTDAVMYYQHDVQKFGGYSYGNSTYTNAYYVPLLEQSGSKKRVVLYRGQADDGFFSEFTAARHRNSIVFSGGFPSILNKGAITQISFPTYPEDIRVAITNNGSTNSYSSLGNVAFCATYEFTTGDGLLYRTSPSPSVSNSLTNVQNVITVTVPGIPAESNVSSDKPIVPRTLVIYRTEPNGTQWFECARRSLTNASSTSVVVNAETLVQSDAFGTSPYLRALYTQTEAENIYPFSHKCGCTHADRYFYATGDSDIYYSKPTAGGVGLEFNEFFNIKVPASGGEITALASMDDKLVIFKRNEVYTTYGDGFGPNLGGSNFAPPRRVALGTGCSNRLCVAVIPQGVLFLSDSGIWLLGRDEQLTRIGSNVAYYTSSYTYTCAATNSKKRYAIFVSKDSGAPALIFSFDTGIWTTFTGLYSGQKFVACDDDGNDIVGGGINTAATVSTNAGDAFLPIYMTNSSSSETFNAAAETGWYALSGLLGYQRWKSTTLFMENRRGHKLSINTAYDGDPLWTDHQEFDSNSLATYDYTTHFGSMTNTALADQTYKLEFAGSRQKTDMIRHQFVASNILGGSISFLGMAFDVAQKTGPVRLGASKKIQ